MRAKVRTGRRAGRLGGRPGARLVDEMLSRAQGLLGECVDGEDEASGGRGSRGDERDGEAQSGRGRAGGVCAGGRRCSCVRCTRSWAVCRAGGRRVERVSSLRATSARARRASTSANSSTRPTLARSLSPLPLARDTRKRSCGLSLSNTSLGERTSRPTGATSRPAASTRSSSRSLQQALLLELVHVPASTVVESALLSTARRAAKRERETGRTQTSSAWPSTPTAPRRPRPRAGRASLRRQSRPRRSRRARSRRSRRPPAGRATGESRARGSSRRGGTGRGGRSPAGMGAWRSARARG